MVNDTGEQDPHHDGPRVSARAVILDQDERLLVVRQRAVDRDVHVLPGGRVEIGETAAEAVRREVWEETGLRVTVGDLLWVREFLPERHLGHPLHTTAMQQLQLVFHAHLQADPASAEPRRPDRSQTALVWHPLADLDSLTLLPLGLNGYLAALAAGPTSPMYLGDLA
ncbi:NUDIX domain-containing protein [Streptacidiphilus pinicola]|uniref:NUDIX domain-containing protein n=1 Tax=Streptacidiphilus pinicola TaxID=2219663 RepID=UPI001A9FD7EA|nr:NUDIX domain-containing protein [Streptacidiphilus pinicola]